MGRQIENEQAHYLSVLMENVEMLPTCAVIYQLDRTVRKNDPDIRHSLACSLLDDLGIPLLADSAVLEQDFDGRSKLMALLDRLDAMRRTPNVLPVVVTTWDEIKQSDIAISRLLNEAFAVLLTDGKKLQAIRHSEQRVGETIKYLLSVNSKLEDSYKSRTANGDQSHNVGVKARGRERALEMLPHIQAAVRDHNCTTQGQVADYLNSIGKRSKFDTPIAQNHVSKFISNAGADWDEILSENS